jgi:hypothetical protein
VQILTEKIDRSTLLREQLRKFRQHLASCGENKMGAADAW